MTNGHTIARLALAATLSLAALAAAEETAAKKTERETFMATVLQTANVRLPGGDYKRYLGVRYTVATGPLTAGKFSAFITKDAQANRAYKSGWTVG